MRRTRRPRAGAAASAFARIAALDRAMSDYRPDSEINDVARRAPAAMSVSPDVFRVVSRAIEIARDTDGAFDPDRRPARRAVARRAGHRASPGARGD